MKRHLFTLAALAALVLGACGDEDTTEDAETGEIAAVVERIATSGDPAVCTEAQTQAFTETSVGGGVSGEQAIEQCERDAERGVADSVEVTDVEIDGESATANAAITGSTFDGQTLSLALIREDGAWKLDQFTGFEKFDREELITSFTEELTAAGPEALVACVRETLDSLTDEEIQGYLLNPDQAAIAQVFGPCEKQLGQK